MKHRLWSTVLMSSLLMPLPALATEATAAGPTERPTVRFVHPAGGFLGLPSLDVPAGPRVVTDWIKLDGGTFEGQRWQIMGHADPLLDALTRSYLYPVNYHPHANIRQLFSISPKATASLESAEAAAGRSDALRNWGYLLAVPGALMLGAGAGVGAGGGTGQVLFYSGAGLFAASLVPAFMAGWSGHESRTHVREAVERWNAGQ